MLVIRAKFSILYLLESLGVNHKLLTLYSNYQYVLICDPYIYFILFCEGNRVTISEEMLFIDKGDQLEIIVRETVF